MGVSRNLLWRSRLGPPPHCPCSQTWYGLGQRWEAKQSGLKWAAGEQGSWKEGETLGTPSRRQVETAVSGSQGEPPPLFSDSQAVVRVPEPAPRSPGDLLHPPMPTPHETEKQVHHLHLCLCLPCGNGGGGDP